MQTNIKKNISKIFWIQGSLILLFFVLAVFFEGQAFRSTIRIVSDAQNVIETKEASVRRQLLKVDSFLKIKSPKDLFREFNGKNGLLQETENSIVLVYDNDSLVFWSTNSASIEEYMRQVCLDNPLAKLRNGYYQVISNPGNQKSNRKIFGLILVKYNYPYQNKYLENNFSADLKFPKETQLIESPSKNDLRLYDKEGNVIFGIKIQSTSSTENSSFMILSSVFYFLFLGTILILINMLLVSVFKIEKKAFFTFCCFSLMLFILRYLMIQFSIPEILSQNPLFDFSVFGDSQSFWNNNLGNLLYNVIAILTSSILFSKSELSFSDLRKEYRLMFFFIVISAICLISHYTSSLFHSLVENSNISFDLSQLSKLSSYSIMVLLLISLLFFSFYLWIEKTYVILLPELNNQRKKLFSIGLFLLLLFAFRFYFSTDFWSVIWPLAALFLLYILKNRNQTFSFAHGIVFVLLFSLVSNFYFTKYEEEKEVSRLKVYAEWIASSKDEIAENLFSDINKKILSDSKIQEFLFSNPVRSLDMEQRLRQFYFRGYWERYKIVFAAIDSICTPLIKNENSIFENNSYFDELIQNYGEETQSENLYFINRDGDKLGTYIGRIPIKNANHPYRKPSVFYFQFEAQTEPDPAGFPELLLDKSVKTNKELADYSFLHFKKGKIIQRSGVFPIEEKMVKSENHVPVFQTSNSGIKYISLFTGEDNQILIAKTNESFSSGFTTFACFFMFFSFVLWLFVLMKDLSISTFKEGISLNNKVQLLVVSLILLSMLGIGLGTFYFIQKQFDRKNKSLLDEKMRGVVKELERNLGDQNILRQNYNEYTSYLLQNYSSVFKTDISLFDLKGNLFASSQDKVYEEGIISKKMNPLSYQKTFLEYNENFVVKEEVGKLNYFSAYHLLSNKEGKALAYVNLPYFSKQSDLEKEINTYFVTLLNVFIILFTLSMLTGIFISSQITKPLRIIQNRLSKIRLGSVHEPIEWNNKDEIGKLVNEYNFMISKLEKSAELLAKSEREVAWREMAKQVAHEIKNPLTPMKLSVQHLLRTAENKQEELEVRVKNLCQMLIEQIDSLAEISNAFSEFAKMPKPSFESICLNEILKSVEQLYQEPDLNMSLRINTDENLIIRADKQHVLRILNNLIKNAIQSIPKERKGEVKVTLEKTNNEAMIKVEDNGCGISEENLKNIFVPNFSTKSEGMGLGLAMVKNMVESSDGKIWFRSVEDEGSCFFLTFPVLKPTSSA